MPLILILLYGLIIYLARGVIPSADELIDTFALLYARFGYEIIFVAAFLESLAVITYFVPGSIALALGVVFAKTGQTELVGVIGVAVFGAVLAYQLDYILGYFGFGDLLKKMGYGNLLNQSQKQLHRFGNRGLILGFIHANFGSLFSLAAGATNYPWPKFFIICTSATLFWGILWGIVIYSLGDIVLLILRKYSFLIFMLFGALFLLSIYWKRKDKS